MRPGLHKGTALLRPADAFAVPERAAAFFDSRAHLTDDILAMTVHLDSHSDHLTKAISSQHLNQKIHNL